MSKTALRDVLGEYMVEIGKRNSKVLVVNADLSGTCRTRNFTSVLSNRSFNVGIAEQNLISFAAGLAHEGFIPYTFSMAPFISMRACEQCYTDVAYANVPVRMVTTYAGVSGGISGATHWSIEDCAIMQAMPNMVVLEPCDPIQAKMMLEYSVIHKGPIYIRSSVIEVETIYDDSYEFELGKASVVTKGRDATIICSGVIVQYALIASKELNDKYGICVQVLDMHTIKPIDRESVIKAANMGPVLVAQDHNVIGGLGAIVAMVIAEACIATKFKVLGIPDKFEAMAHAKYLYNKYYLDAEGIVKEMLSLMEN